MKKGFTLIELLAVILILGIIALIAIPTVNNILKESRRGAFNSTLNNLEKAIEEKCTTEQIKNQEITTMYTITNGVITPKLDIKGELPDGVIYVNKDCEVSFTLSDNNFTGTKEVGEEIVIVDKGNSNTITVYKEEILNGTDPVITGGLIPVTIANDGTVKKADLTTKWYSYAEKKWANAVMLTDTGKVEEDGTILEDSIESYFVWIPRYKYKLFDMGLYTGLTSTSYNGENRKVIEIEFENKNTPASVGTTVGEYHSHPAFGAFDVNGLWVGKFETTGSTSNLTIKPGKQSLRDISVKQIFEISYNYKRENDSHMMKNTEWGAVAYLTLSEYGLKTEPNINNNSNRLTGYSSVVTEGNGSLAGDNGTDASITKPYNTEVGYKASTTGNITGIYDTTGLLYEYVAAFVEGDSNYTPFQSNPVSTYGDKYFDVYPADSGLQSYNNRILGDATGEIGPFFYSSGNYINNWFFDCGSFITPGNWFIRSGEYSYQNFAGILSFNRTNGSLGTASFRVVLAK